MATMLTLEEYLRARYAESGETEFRLRLVKVAEGVRAFVSPAYVAGRGADVTITGNEVSVRELGVMTPPQTKPRGTDPRHVGRL